MSSMKPQQSQNVVNGFMNILQVTVVVAEGGGWSPWPATPMVEATHRDKNKGKHDDSTDDRDYDNVWAEPALSRDNNKLDDAMNLRVITRIYISSPWSGGSTTAFDRRR